MRFVECYIPFLLSDQKNHMATPNKDPIVLLFGGSFVQNLEVYLPKNYVVESQPQKTTTRIWSEVDWNLGTVACEAPYDVCVLLLGECDRTRRQTLTNVEKLRKRLEQQIKKIFICAVPGNAPLSKALSEKYKKEFIGGLNTENELTWEDGELSDMGRHILAANIVLCVDKYSEGARTKVPNAYVRGGQKSNRRIAFNSKVGKHIY